MRITLIGGGASRAGGAGAGNSSNSSPGAASGRRAIASLLLLAWTFCWGVTLATPPTASAADARVIKLASLIPSGSFWDRALKTMGAEWQETTAGRVQLRIYSGGVAGDDPDVLRKMRIGQLQAATITVSGLSDIDPAFALFEIPMFFNSYEELFHLLEALQPDLETRLEARGYVLLHWVQAGWVHFFTTEPVDSFDELQALKVFQWAGEARMEQLWRDNGFKPVPLAGTDILLGLRTGMFSALPSTPIAALSLQWFRSAPYMIDLGVAPFIGATLIDKRTWDELAAEDQASMLAAGRAAGAFFEDQIEQQDVDAIREMQKRGLRIKKVVGTPLEAPWQSAALAFANDMREAFVPAEVFDRALEIRTAYRARRTEPGQASDE